MKTHRELLDNYHEASWCLAMEQVSIHQGKQAGVLEEELNDNPDAAVPQHTIDRCQQAIRTAFAPKVGKQVRRVLYRAVVAALLCAFLTMAAYAFSPRFREFLTGLFSYVTQTFTAVTLQDPHVENVVEQQDAIVYRGYGLELAWLPEGYWCADGKEDEKLRRVDFTDDQSNAIRIRVTNTESVTASTYDNETGTVTPVEVGQLDGWIVKSKESLMLRLIDEQAEKYVAIFASDLSQDHLIQLAKGLRY